MTSLDAMLHCVQWYSLNRFNHLNFIRTNYHLLRQNFLHSHDLKTTLTWHHRMATLECVLQADSERNKRRLWPLAPWSQTQLLTSHVQKSEHKIRNNVSALNQRHTNPTSQDLFDAAWTHIHLKNVCVLIDGCFSPFVMSNKWMNHHGKRISSHLMADKWMVWHKCPALSLCFTS